MSSRYKVRSGEGIDTVIFTFSNGLRMMVDNKTEQVCLWRQLGESVNISIEGLLKVCKDIVGERRGIKPQDYEALMLASHLEEDLEREMIYGCE
jgi:hypothetical protein